MSYFIEFTNDSPLPINIETWQRRFLFLSEVKSITVRPGETINMGSETGEWMLNTYFTDRSMDTEWNSAGHPPGEVIGRFTDKPHLYKFNWMCNPDFEVIYNAGKIYFRKK